MMPVQVMFRSLVALTLLTVLPGYSQAPGPLTNQRILELVKAGVSPSELTRIIATAPTVQFDLTPSAEQTLMQNGVSDDVIRSMAARELSGPREANAAAPIAVTQPTVTVRSHRLRNWLIIGAVAGGLGYLGYALSNPSAAPAPPVHF
jgi:hypothetical protein